MSRVTSEDVARLAGVSRTTVSFVLNNKPDARISETTRAKVLQAAAKLGYLPNRIAQSLKTNRTGVIGLVLPTISNSFFPLIAQGVEDTAWKHGYATLICSSSRNPVKEESYITALASRRVDGVILAPVSGSARHLEPLTRSETPIVSLDRKLSDSNIDCVRVNDMEGGEMAVSYLLSLGHRNIGFISSPTTVTSRQDRLLGYRKALEKARIPYDKRRVLVYEGEEDECLDVTYEFQVGLALGKRLLEDNPETTAIFAANDMIAIGAIKAIQALGLSVPDDVSVIGFDDVPIAQMCIPPLTTLAQPKYEIGKAATEMLITRVEQGANFDYVGTKLFSPKLVERESCRPPNRRL